MSLIQITPHHQQVDTREFALFNLGFRPFFLAASAFSAITILVWILVYSFQIPLAVDHVSLFEWHAHQMIYGFSMAVIAGFLLTAVMNWTNIQTLNGMTLKILLLCWLIPRVSLLGGTSLIEVAAFFDLLFFIGLFYGVSAPIVRTRQWRQIGILLQLALLGTGNACFYLDALQMYPNGGLLGIYGGLYLIVGLILTIGGRVMPPFIRNGLEHPVEIRNPFWVAAASFVSLAVFILNQLFIHHSLTTGVTAGVLFVLTLYRLACWHTIGIWSKPLLWGLFGSYIFICLGFLLVSIQTLIGISPFVATHAFAYGGIGLATLAMMIRVAVGHTGRSIGNTPPGTIVLLLSLAAGALVRVVLPLITSNHYRLIVLSAQALWFVAFTGFLILFTKMLCAPRADGKAG